MKTEKISLEEAYTGSLVGICTLIYPFIISMINLLEMYLVSKVNYLMFTILTFMLNLVYVKNYVMIGKLELTMK